MNFGKDRSFQPSRASRVMLVFRYYMGGSKNMGFNPQIIPIVHRVFHYFHHPFWWFSPYIWKHPYTHYCRDLFASENSGKFSSSTTPPKKPPKGDVFCCLFFSRLLERMSGLGAENGWSTLERLYTPVKRT